MPALVLRDVLAALKDEVLEFDGQNADDPGRVMDGFVAWRWGQRPPVSPLYLAGLADHPFDPADVLNLPGGFLAAWYSILMMGYANRSRKGSFAGMALSWCIPVYAVVATGLVWRGLIDLIHLFSAVWEWVCVCWAGLATVGSLVVLVSLFAAAPLLVF
ncbi:hypothetical protein Nepgr_009304 [Nepenthes gracilis]|uniref:Uncharacterized protein n=1 Tax=Nepenthes gracilis TaxID=150966 RepID=A0AAD3SB91_NEPGR|nr:hypothetical protein Nepgr_009304 [Nepenthes gracilis]